MKSQPHSNWGLDYVKLLEQTINIPHLQSENQLDPLWPCGKFWIDSITTNLFTWPPWCNPQDVFYQSKVSHDVNMTPTLCSPSLKEICRWCMIVFPHITWTVGRIKPGLALPRFVAHVPSTQCWHCFITINKLDTSLKTTLWISISWRIDAEWNVASISGGWHFVYIRSLCQDPNAI